MSKLSPFWNTWYNWKSLRLPWRRHILAGRDLEGNTYWEFPDASSGRPSRPGSVRMRRIVQYPRGTHPGAVKVPPMWHQWLRHVRVDAPTLQEQQLEVVRQQQMRLLAAEADARWAGAKRVEEAADIALGVAAMPGTASPAAATAATAAATATTAPGTASEPTPEPAPVHATPARPSPQQPQDDPWKKAQIVQGNPGDSWQPAAWTPPTPPKH